MRKRLRRGRRTKKYFSLFFPVLSAESARVISKGCVGVVGTGVGGHGADESFLGEKFRVGKRRVFFEEFAAGNNTPGGVVEVFLFGGEVGKVNHFV